VDDFQFYRDQLWTAPELLRMTTRPINGTQKADVYSFAIVLQEIVFRAEPYFIDFGYPKSLLILVFLLYDMFIPGMQACQSIVLLAAAV